MRVMITCGGTGGHITPALAIADVIKWNLPTAQILFVGTEGGMENAMVTAAGYAIKPLAVKGWQRGSGLSALRALYLAEKGAREARRLIEAFRPDIVIGTGSYASYPALRAAAAMGIPTAVHESNAVPGLAVRLLAPRLERIWLNFEAAGKMLREKERLLVVGNPLRQQALTVTPATRPSGCEKMLLSFGGSLGADALNRAVIDMMKEEAALPGLYHLHATGKRCYDGFLAQLHAAGLRESARLRIVPFITDMAAQMATADVVISRAGAVSISELAAMGKAAVLIPSPNVTGNHQYKNAATLAEKGAAILLAESELSGERLWREVRILLSDEAKRKAMQKAISTFARPDAGRQIFEDVLYLTGTKRA